MQRNPEQTWDIFCRVIDNYGDIGVCWRLARQVAGEYGRRVRLWVDEPAALQAICPETDPALAVQTCQQVEIHHWTDDFTVDRPGDVIIEAFACELPAAYLTAMAQAAQRPVWINLEYLSAESWAEEWHGLVSPHPTLPLQKTFFFPGFSERSGGLLREQGLIAQADAYRAANACHTADAYHTANACRATETLLPLQGGGREGDGFPQKTPANHTAAALTHPHPSPPLEGEGVFRLPSAACSDTHPSPPLEREGVLGASVAREETLHISLFCYDTAPVGPWLVALAASPQACVCYVPPGKPLAAVRAHLDGDGPWQLGRARIEPIPFLALDDYDRLLWRCDINFIRGEDSFVRAQWAGKPFIWQIYRQEEDAHLVKLAAFLDRCCPQGSWRRMHETWNTGEGIAAAWQDFLAERQTIANAALAWRADQAALPDLAATLVKFCDKRL